MARVRVELTSTVFRKNTRGRVVANGLSRKAKKFKREVQQQQIDGPHTGVVYPQDSGDRFSRGHRASAWGEHPAPNTFNLVNSHYDKALSPTEHEVGVDDARANYAGPLQDRLNRPIITVAHADHFDRRGEGARENERIIRNLISD